LVYKYKTEVKLSVANGQYDLKNEITADVNIKSLGHCNYALQVKFVLQHFLLCFLIEYFHSFEMLKSVKLKMKMNQL
jgi:hypothetical protein